MKRAPIHRLYTRIAADHRAEHPGRKVRILSVLGMRAQESRARALLPQFAHDPRASNQTIRHVDQWLLAVAGEYRHKTITDTYLSAPARSAVIAAKLVVYALFGALSGVASTVVGLIVAAALWSDKGASFAWGNSAMWATIGGGIAWNAAFAAIGVGVGALIRSLVGAIAVALAWIALVEGIVGQLIGNLARWLPFDAGQASAPPAGRCSPPACCPAGAARPSWRRTRQPSPRLPSLRPSAATCRNAPGGAPTAATAEGSRANLSP